MDEKGNLGYVESAIDRTKAYHNSNLIRHFDGILIPGSEKDLGNFSKQNKLATGNSMDTLSDERLQKFTVKKMMPTKHLDEVDLGADIYLISDPKGFDIGTYNAKTGEFKLSPAIKEVNKKMIEKVPGAKGLEKEFGDPSLGVVLDKLAKGESLVLTSEEQVKSEVVKAKQKEFAESGFESNIDDSNEEQLSDEEKTMSNLPDGAKAEVMAIKEKLPPGTSIKEILIVNSPSTMADSLGKESGIKAGNGPVVLVRTVGKGAELSDDVYMFQDENELPKTKENEQDILEVMDQHKDEGVVPDFKDTEKEEILKDIEDKMKEADEKVNELRESDFESEEDRNKAIANVYTELGHEVEVQIDHHDRDDLNEYVEVIEDKAEAAQEGEISDSDEEDDRFEKNRWESASPFNPSNNH